MGGHRCCSKEKVKRGLWSPEEDEKLMKHITTHGHGSWSSVPKLAGLQRCGKSCRLRWINYLRPDLKKGSFTEEEEQIIIDVHRILGNRWAQIAKHLPGRTDNEVKNFWNSCIKKKLMSQGLDPQTHNLISSHQIRASNNNNNKKNIVTSFVVSRENHEQEPISVFSMSSSSHEITNVICSNQDQQHQVLTNPPFDITLPNAISTFDHHQNQNPSSSSSTTSSTAWTLKGQNSPQIDNIITASSFQQYYGSSSIENTNAATTAPNISSSSSSSSHVEIQNLSRSCNLLDHEFGIWGSSFEPLETPRLESDHQQPLQGHDHNDDHDRDEQIKQLQYNEKNQMQNDDGLVEKYSSFDLGFMESALMSDVMCTNDFSSIEYDMAWNY